jgi:hypothetical protein
VEDAELLDAAGLGDVHRLDDLLVLGVLVGLDVDRGDLGLLGGHAQAGLQLGLVDDDLVDLEAAVLGDLDDDRLLSVAGSLAVALGSLTLKAASLLKVAVSRKKMSSWKVTSMSGVRSTAAPR